MDNKLCGAVVGFAVGEAMGLPLEYQERKKLINHPITKMTKCESHNLKPGTWSKGTSSILATMNAIVTKNKIDYPSIADNLCDWYFNSKFTATDRVIDVGHTTKQALSKYRESSLEPCKCGQSGYSECDNEVLPRMIPISFYLYYKKARDYDIYSTVKNISLITHANEISIMACYIFVNYILFLLSGKDKMASYSMIKCLDYTMYFKYDTIREFDTILKNNVYRFSLDRIDSSNFIINTLETFFYVILNCDSFSQSIIGSINLGGATTIIGGLCGSVAGIIYDYSSIPSTWLNTVIKKDDLVEEASKFETTLKII